MTESVAHLIISNRRYGGGVYGNYISKLEHVKNYPLITTNSRNKFVKLGNYYINLFKFSKKSKEDTIIRNMDGAFFMSRKKRNIVVFHHYHPISNNKSLFLYQKFVYRNLLKVFDTIDTLVVVSNYWRKYFETLNIPIKRVKVVYNPFEIELYHQREREEIDRFKAKYDLDDRPIVYIGNPQREKGTQESYEALKGLDIQMVSSGISHIKLPIKHLELSFYDYITLLQASSLSVLMSNLKEGWNRVAHESILCKTPVIGTGYGGMGELLSGAEQTVCRDFRELPELVKKSLENPTLSERAYRYAKSFDMDRFKSAWEEILIEQ